MRMSLRRISSSLCSVARETITPATSTGSSSRHRVEAAGAPDVDVDRIHARRHLRGGELVRRRPARLARDVAEFLLQAEAVHLDDDAVDLEVERVALLAPVLAALPDLIKTSCSMTMSGWTGSRARAASPALALAARHRGAPSTSRLVGEEAERARWR